MVALWYLDFNNHVCRVLKHRDRYVEIKLELRGEGVHFEEDWETSRRTKEMHYRKWPLQIASS